MKSDDLSATPKKQTILNLTIDRQVEIDGVQMGVMSDGTAYLTGRGLSLMCGVVHSVRRMFIFYGGGHIKFFGQSPRQDRAARCGGIVNCGPTPGPRAQVSGNLVQRH
jgi:hypothetical protein